MPKMENSNTENDFLGEAGEYAGTIGLGGVWGESLQTLLSYCIFHNQIKFNYCCYIFVYYRFLSHGVWGIAALVCTQSRDHNFGSSPHCAYSIALLSNGSNPKVPQPHQKKKIRFVQAIGFSLLIFLPSFLCALRRDRKRSSKKKKKFFHLSLCRFGDVGHFFSPLFSSHFSAISFLPSVVVRDLEEAL